jgi:hypothetical protein
LNKEKDKLTLYYIKLLKRAAKGTGDKQFMEENFDRILLRIFMRRRA